MINLIFHLV